MRVDRAAKPGDHIAPSDRDWVGIDGRRPDVGGGIVEHRAVPQIAPGESADNTATFWVEA